MVEQGTDEWKALRCGKVTASRMADLTAKTKSGWGASRANLMAQLIVERLTGQPQETYTNAAMQWGNDTEPQARAAYELTRCEVEQIGFVPHPSIHMAGCSPDGLVGDDGLIEIKCPASATHIETLLNPKILDKYIKQMQFQMACTGRKWCDWMTFDPRMPVDLQIKIIRVSRDDDMIEELENAAEAFLVELDGKLAALEKMREI